ncbi:isoaspartyl peptidase/L-asparaginase family protein [Algoriphagus limi]|uniref:Isoaspartyl peptidase/L-asparaginase n=1 Tax=Algoriphagus limi TaxID=2975273 RepID=A0ABT2G855_9BACT|nr:isoaspartyl peptidase/L-asparaginase [Algoriphagus limi]MCS5491458.1 isoaspartyl peptidase/L-asparaginase [Algoriphagus limi]
MKTSFIFTSIFCLFFWSCSQNTENQQVENQATEKVDFALAIHGGAGTIRKENMTPEQDAAYRAKLKEALDAGYAVLESGGTAIDAVISAVKVMEDSPLFNAGKGAVFTNEGKNELDAAIMNGIDRNAGAVAGLTTVKNPITAARAVMENSPHVFMTGAGAEQFASEQNLKLVSPDYFYTDFRFEQLEKIRETEKTQLDHSSLLEMELQDPLFKDRKFGTVGAVALDKNGNIAAATSTGGMTNKRYGRVGDVPIIGAGTYADNETCAVSATGHGEYFIRNVVGHEIASLIRYGNKNLTEAADEVVMNQLVEMGGSGGIISIDRFGNIAMPFNSEGMYRGYRKAGEEAKTFIYKDEN